MSTAVAIDVADAVAAALNAAPDGTFNETVAAVRAYVARFEPSDLTALKVTVVPKSLEVERADRAQTRNEYAIDIAIQKKLSELPDDADCIVDNDEVDALMLLVQQIAEHIASLGRLTTYTAAKWIGTANSPIYSQEHLIEKRTFTSVLTLTFRVDRNA
ncbi:hypothetical protein LCGC14_2556660 [marine sediment metagenome]|uniref:Uncharacterized protein n=1 Tax=marine sediment metagenome TaxID=412755 RepID=A0A0F9B988_9ZZZZ